MTIAAATDPAVAMVMAMADHDIRTANHAADDAAAGDCANSSGDDGAGARTDGNAFQRSSLDHDGHCRQHRNQHSSLENRAHEKFLG
jgi:hypothetical protein